MLHINIQDSRLQKHLRWRIEATLRPGVCYHLKAPNGSGKTTFIAELKYRWAEQFPSVLLGFVDQETLAPFQDLTVAGVMNIVWDVLPTRRMSERWQELAWWREESVQKLWSRKVSELSGGENQWVKILMMRSLKSHAWIMDEPFQSLDQHRQTELWALMSEWLNNGHYLLLVHHGECQIPTEILHLMSASDGLSLRGEA